MARETRPMDLREETWKVLEDIKSALNHEDLEETVQLLAALGFQAIAVTDAENPNVYLMGGARIPEEHKCPKCGVQTNQPVFEKQGQIKLG